MSRISGAKPEIDEHKADRENPHDVDDGQTGAADSLTNHEDSTGDVHGVPAGDSVAGQSDVDAVTTDLSDHSGSSSGVHGVGASNVESESGAQSKADSAESSANSYTDDHENKSNPHSGSASDTDLSNHVNDGTNPHGVSASQTGALASSDYNPEADTHSRPTGTQPESQDGEFIETASQDIAIQRDTVSTATFDLSPVITTDETFVDLSNYSDADSPQDCEILEIRLYDGQGLFRTENPNVYLNNISQFTYLHKGRDVTKVEVDAIDRNNDGTISATWVEPAIVTNRQTFLPEHSHSI